MSLADGADLIFSGINFEDAASNVAEHYGIPFATLHYFPLRPNSRVLPSLPAPLARALVRAFWWMSWRGTKKAEDTQRRDLGLPKATRSAPWRITQRGSLEIQAYDEACFPGLAAEWALLGEPVSMPAASAYLPDRATLRPTASESSRLVQS